VLDQLDRHECLRPKVMYDEYKLAWANIEGWINQRQQTKRIRKEPQATVNRLKASEAYTWPTF
jgi:hypothetical protein